MVFIKQKTKNRENGKLRLSWLNTKNLNYQSGFFNPGNFFQNNFKE